MTAPPDRHRWDDHHRGRLTPRRNAWGEPAGRPSFWLDGAPARGGASARIDQQNDQGGVNRRHIDLVWGDDQSDPDAFGTTCCIRMKGAGST
jgi:hypothetical protein